MEDKLWELDWMIAKEDTNGDKSLNLREFALVRTKDEYAALVTRLFKILDTDNNGILTSNEFREVKKEKFMYTTFSFFLHN